MANPIVNQINYSWSDIQAFLFGDRPIVGIASIEYDEEDVDIIQSRTIERRLKYVGSVELYIEEINNIIAISPLGKIQLIPPFDIKVVYGNKGLPLDTDILHDCIFMKNPFKGRAIGKKLTMKIPILIGDINNKQKQTEDENL